MSDIPRENCPIENDYRGSTAKYGGSDRTHLVLELIDRAEGTADVCSFSTPIDELDDPQLKELKERVQNCTACEAGQDCALGTLIMRAQFTDRPTQS